MLKFLKIKYKNFLSSGNYWTEINFTKTSSTLIVGKNGAGKSTFLDALTFVLFNKPFRKINKNQLVNSMNEKNCVVEIEFEIGPNKWKIIRGIKPTIFEIYENGELLNQSSASNDQQKWVEQTVLKLNYKSFTQIVVLGSSNFVPFMQLSSQHRREVVEDLLSIKVFSSMNDIAKVNIKSLRDEVKELQYKKENCQDKIDTQNNFIAELEKRNTQDIKEKDKKLKELVDKKQLVVDLNSFLLDSIKTKSKDLDSVSSSVSKLKKLDSIKVKLFQKLS